MVDPSDKSYTYKLFKNETKICKKVVEKVTEHILSIKDRNIDEEASEPADLIHHTIRAAKKSGLPMLKAFEKLLERQYEIKPSYTQHIQ